MKFQKPIAELAHDYQAQNMLQLPELIDPETTDTLLRAIHENPFGKVDNAIRYPEQGHIHWGEQWLSDPHPVYTFCGQSALTELVYAATGEQLTGEHWCWSNRYLASEHIGPHKDRNGTASLLICLQTTEGPEFGGSLVIETDQESPTQVFLRPGDGFLFKGTDYEHYTEPLQPSTANPEPERIIVAARYFAAA